MHGISRVAGVGPRVTINGKDYQVRGKTNRFYAELEAELLKMRGDPFEMIVEAGRRARIDKDEALLNNVADVIAAKFRNWRVMTYRDYLEFANSPTGEALTVLHCLKQDSPELTLADVKDYLARVKLEGTDEQGEEMKALFDAIQVASGEDLLGNSNGQPLIAGETLALERTGS